MSSRTARKNPFGDAPGGVTRADSVKRRREREAREKREARTKAEAEVRARRERLEKEKREKLRRKNSVGSDARPSTGTGTGAAAGAQQQRRPSLKGSRRGKKKPATPSAPSSPAVTPKQLLKPSPQQQKRTGASAGKGSSPLNPRRPQSGAGPTGKPGGTPASGKKSPLVSPPGSAASTPPSRAKSKRKTTPPTRVVHSSSNRASPKMTRKNSFKDFAVLAQDQDSKMMARAQLAAARKQREEDKRKQTMEKEEIELEKEAAAVARRNLRRSIRRRDSHNRLSRTLSESESGFVLLNGGNPVSGGSIAASIASSRTASRAGSPIPGSPSELGLVGGIDPAMLADALATGATGATGAGSGSGSASQPGSPALTPGGGKALHYFHAYYDVLEFSVRKGGGPLGFSMKASTEPAAPASLAVNTVKAGSAAAVVGVAKGDLLYEVDGTDLRALAKADATTVMKNTGGVVSLIVGRKRPEGAAPNVPTPARVVDFFALSPPSTPSTPSTAAAAVVGAVAPPAASTDAEADGDAGPTRSESVKRVVVVDKDPARPEPDVGVEPAMVGVEVADAPSAAEDEEEGEGAAAAVELPPAHLAPAPSAAATGVVAADTSDDDAADDETEDDSSDDDGEQVDAGFSRFAQSSRKPPATTTATTGQEKARPAAAAVNDDDDDKDSGSGSDEADRGFSRFGQSSKRGAGPKKAEEPDADADTDAGAGEGFSRFGQSSSRRAQSPAPEDDAPAPSRNDPGEIAKAAARARQKKPESQLPPVSGSQLPDRRNSHRLVRSDSVIAARQPVTDTGLVVEEEYSNEPTAAAAALDLDMPGTDAPPAAASGQQPQPYLAAHLTQLRAKIRQLSARGMQGFVAEFKHIQSIGTKNTARASEHVKNFKKNRYTNVKAYDHSRVKLSIVNHDPHSDYINANFVGGRNQPKEYIASQGPIPTTFVSFWRMVWEQQSGVIVMTTKEIEKGKRKCYRYWPDPSSSPPCTKLRYGEITVMHVSTEPADHFIRRSFMLKKGKEIRHLDQFVYTLWPDHGVPSTTAEVLTFREAIRAAMAECDLPGPPVIHCSAGVGRTGTLIALDRLLEGIRLEEDSIDVPAVVADMRNARNLMVQSQVQYIFVYRALADAIEQLMGANAPPLAPQPAKPEAAAKASGSERPAERGAASTSVAASPSAKRASSSPHTKKRASVPDGKTLVQVQPAPSLEGKPEEAGPLHALQTTPVAKWTPKQVNLWLGWHGLMQYGPGFEEEEVNGKALLAVSEDLLGRTGVRAAEDREHLLAAILALEQNPARALDARTRRASIKEAFGRHRLSGAPSTPKAKARKPSVSSDIVGLPSPITHVSSRTSVVKVQCSQLHDCCMYKKIAIYEDSTAVDILALLIDKCHVYGMSPSNFVIAAITANNINTLHENQNMYKVASTLDPDSTRLEIKRRTIKQSSGQIVIDTALLSQSSKAVSVPIAETASASAVVMQLLKMCGVNSDARHFCLQEVDASTNVPGRLIRDEEAPLVLMQHWVSPRSKVFRIARRTPGDAEADDDSGLAKIQEQLIEMREAKAALWMDLQRARDTAGNAERLKEELGTLKNENLRLEGLLVEAETQKDFASQKMKESEAPAEDVEELRGELKTVRQENERLGKECERLPYYQDRVQVIEDALQQLQTEALKREKTERGLRERMEAAYKAKTRRGSAPQAGGFAALQAALAEKDVLIDRLRDESRTKGRELYKRDLKMSDLRHSALQKGGAPDGARTLENEQSEALIQELMSERDTLVEEKFAAEDKLHGLEKDLQALRQTARQDGEGGAGSSVFAAKGHHFRDFFTITEDRVLLAMLLEKSEGSVLGLGIQQKDGAHPGEIAGVYVKTVLPDSAASDAGLKPGDQLLEVDGESLIEATKDACLSALKSTGRTVRLVVARKGLVDIVPAKSGGSKESLQQVAALEESLAEQVEEMAALREAHATELEAAEAKHLELVAAIEQAEGGDTALRQLREQLAATSAHKDASSPRVADLQDQLKDKELAYEALASGSASTEKALEEANGVISQLRVELAHAQDKHNDHLHLASQSKESQADSTQKLRLALEDQKAAAKRAQASLEAQVAMLKADEHKSAKKLQMELVAARQQAARLQSEKEEGLEQMGRLNVEKVQAQTSLDKTNRQLDAASAEAKALATKVKAAETARQSAEAALEATVGSLDADIKQKDDLIEMLRTKMRQAQATSATLVSSLQQQLETQGDAHEGKVNAIQLEFSTHQKKLIDQIKHQQQQLDSAQDRLRKLETTGHAREQHVLALQAERDHLVQVMRNQMIDKDERKVSENMAARPARNSDALWDVIESKSKEDILDLLEEKDEEVERLKDYVNHMTVVIMEKEPELLQEISKRDMAHQPKPSRRMSRRASRASRAMLAGHS